MAFPTFISFAFIFLLFASPFVESKSPGFTLDLIHRDSPSSPFFNPSSNRYERLTKVLLRSHERAKFIKSAANSPSSDVIPDGGGYLMNYTLGTPPVSILGVADTGSDLIWTQCAPCENCYSQNAPLFNPSKSTTYKEVSCGSNQCQSLPETSCNANKTCQYQVGYGDNSFSRGKVASETVGLGSRDGTPVSLPKIAIGCGFDNGGTFSENDSGIVGLGNGPVSLISQLSSSIHGKFSYCLLPGGSTTTNGKINFGDNAVVSGVGVVSTPIHIGEPNTFYYLKLYGFSVGTQTIDFRKSSSRSPSKLAENGEPINIIIDSGTTLTYLPSDLYAQLEDEIKKTVEAEPVADPQEALELCYDTSTGLRLPGLTAHFDGADLELNENNVFVHTTESVACLAFSSAADIAIYGNIGQIGFLVGYDLVKGEVSFEPSCGSN